MDACPAGDEDLRDITRIPFSRDMEGRSAVAIWHICLRATVEQEPDDVVLIFFCSEMQRCAAVVVCRVDRSAAVEQKTRHVLASPACCDMQRGLTLSIGNRDRESTVEKSIDLIGLTLFGRQKEMIGRGPAGRKQRQENNQQTVWTMTHLKPEPERLN
jgi:hypothetical protein